MVAPNALGKILCTLAGFLATLVGHAQIHGVEYLVAEFLGGIRELVGVCSNSLNVLDHFLVAGFDGLHHESTHAIDDGGCRA